VAVRDASQSVAASWLSVGALNPTLTPQSSGAVLAGPASGSDALPTFRQIAASDLSPELITQIAAAISAGTVVLTTTTPDATPVLVPGLPAVDLGGGYCLITGTVIAQVKSTRAVTVWNIALVVTRALNATMCEPQGDTTPSIFTQDASMTGCDVTLGSSPAGPSIVLTGVSGLDISWGINLNSTTGD
jgi:hypothetical protein